MLVECGFVRAQTSDGAEFSFTPSLGRIASLGSPHEIVDLFASLHGPDAAAQATYVLACLCDQEDASALIGWRDEVGWHTGEMPAAEQVIIAQHLMRHGIVGTASPEAGDGQFTAEFHAAQYIAAARVHLGLSSQDAEALSMTEFQTMFAMRFPEANKAKRDVPTREQYEATMKAFEERERA